jgi:hypothetical protein
VKRGLEPVDVPYGRALLLGFAIVGARRGGGAPQTLISGMASTWAATTSQGRMVGDYISTSYGSDNRAHGVFATASAPTAGSSCSAVLDNCAEPMNTFASGLAAGGTASGAASPVLFAGTGGGNAQSLWKVVDNNGAKHR